MPRDLKDTMGLKAGWEVRAGVVPGQPIPEHTKQFWYRSVAYEHDTAPNNPQPMHTFLKTRDEATAYYHSLNDPAHFNWASITFLWY